MDIADKVDVVTGLVNDVKAGLDALKAQIAGGVTPPPATVDTAALAAALKPMFDELGAKVDAVSVKLEPTLVVAPPVEPPAPPAAA